MADKLYAGDAFPSLTLNLVGGGTATVPEISGAKYQIILFYRGHWWPYCRRQLAGFASEKAGLDALNATVLGVSVDDAENAATIASDLNFPVAFGATRQQGEATGAWWGDNRGGCIQPSEFIIGADGKVISSTYSSGPIGRVDAADVVKLLNFYEKRDAK
jgi:peroxiredoxin